MKKIKVKITGNSFGDNCWYVNQIGSVMNVVRGEGKYFIAFTFDGRQYYIEECDCEVIEEETPQPEPFDLERALKGEKIYHEGDEGKFMFTNTHYEGNKHVFQVSVNRGKDQAVVYYCELTGNWYGGFNGNELFTRFTMAPKEPEYVETLAQLFTK